MPPVNRCVCVGGVGVGVGGRVFSGVLVQRQNFLVVRAEKHLERKVVKEFRETVTEVGFKTLHRDKYSPARSEFDVELNRF